MKFFLVEIDDKSISPNKSNWVNFSAISSPAAIAWLFAGTEIYNGCTNLQLQG